MWSEGECSIDKESKVTDRICQERGGGWEETKKITVSVECERCEGLDVGKKGETMNRKQMAEGWKIHLFLQPLKLRAHTTVASKASKTNKLPTK